MKYDDDIEHIYLDDDEPAAPKGAGRHAAAAVEDPEAYKKFKKVLLGVLILSSLLTFVRGIELQRFVADFMATFFITFAAFKFIDIEGFAHAYRSYDILASRIRPWGYAVPFLEAFVGFWYLLSEGPLTLNLLAIAVTAIALLGASREVKKKSRFAHTYYDGLIPLPLARVGYIANGLMLAGAILMLVIP